MCHISKDSDEEVTWPCTERDGQRDEKGAIWVRNYYVRITVQDGIGTLDFAAVLISLQFRIALALPLLPLAPHTVLVTGLEHSLKRGKRGLSVVLR